MFRHQFCLDVGTVIIHCHATADESMVKDEREKLITAIQGRNAGEIQQALFSSKEIKDLGEIKDVYDDAQTTLGTLEVEMKEQGQEMKKWVSTKAQANSTTQISVLSVAHPHAILDDLSYKLCKDRRVGRHQ